MFICRFLKADDAQKWKSIFAVGVRNFPLGFLMTPAEVDALTMEKCQSTLKEGGTLGVFVDDLLVGFCGYRQFQPARVRHRGNIGPFFVMENLQGSGAAKALMAEVIAKAKEAGVEQLELAVAQKNHRAIAFYEGQGFVRYGAHPNAVRDEEAGGSGFLYRLLI
jgi:ribosomal protein S18 acetylase RimI-like enzyme